jgi:hypothetical protein
VQQLFIYQPTVTLVGCWAHARRKYSETLKSTAAFGSIS